MSQNFGFSQKLLKVYHFAERNGEISYQCIDLLNKALSGKMPWDSWLEH